MRGVKSVESLTERKKKLTLGKIILVCFIALALVLVATAAIAYLRYVHPTGEIMRDIFAIRTHRNGMPMGNFFLIRAGDKYIAVDAGADDTETENGLRKLGISASDVEAVFITHSHWDHIESLNLFSSATIYTGNIDDSEFPDIAHQIIPDGETIEVSDVIVQCFYTPGHTIDSVCYLIDGKYLFVGDLFVSTNDPPPPIPKRYDKDMQLHYRKEMLALNGVEYIFTSHFGLFKSIRFFQWWFD